MSHELQPSTILFKKYRIENIVGRGGFGAIYKAVDIRLNRVVAIKTLLHNQTTMDQRYGTGTFEAYVDRFKREASISSYFTHNPHIVTVYALEEDEDDNFYLVLEYLEGGSLINLLKSSRGVGLPIAQSCEIILDICTALAEVHKHPEDIVHRDIKPANILLRTNGRAVLADFGIAQVGHESQRTMPNGNTQFHPGSPAYKSPEQSNQHEYLTAASDLYSLGLVFYEMLTGNLFVKQKKLPPSQLNPQVPDWLDKIIVKLLQSEPTARYQEAEELAAEIRAAGVDKTQKTTIEHDELATIPVSPTRSINKTRDRPIKIQHANIPIKEGVEEATEVVDTEKTRLTDEEQQRRVRLDEQIKVLSIQLQQAESRADWQRFIKLGEYLLELDPAQSTIRLRTAAAYAQLGSSQQQRNEEEQALASYSRAIELNPNEEEYYSRRGYIYVRRNEYKRAVADFSRAIELNPDQEIYYSQRGYLHASQNFHDLAVEDFSRVIQLTPRRAPYYWQRGRSYFYKGDYAAAIVDLSHAIQLDPRKADYHYECARSYFCKGDFNQAILYYNQAIELDPRRPVYFAGRGQCFHRKGSYNQAIIDLNRAIELDSTNQEYYYLRGRVYKLQKKLKEAKLDFQRAVDLGYEHARKELADL